MFNSLCSLRSSAWKWVKTHKTIVVVGSIAGIGLTAYLSIKNVVKEAEKMTNELQLQLIEQQRQKYLKYTLTY